MVLTPEYATAVARVIHVSRSGLVGNCVMATFSASSVDIVLGTTYPKFVAGQASPAQPVGLINPSFPAFPQR